MAEANETIADIIAEIRALSNPIPDGIIAINGRIIADRLDAAHKREADYAREAYESALKAEREALREQYEAGALVDGTRGDCAKLREALEELVANIEMRSSTFGLNVMVDTKTFLDAKAALAEPVKNYEVGTAQEQAKRWEKFCSEHHKEWIGGKIPTGPCECPCYEGNSCNHFAWAQLPYESEATDGE